MYLRFHHGKHDSRKNLLEFPCQRLLKQLSDFGRIVAEHAASGRTPGRMD
jgi:hypothetical protein